MAIRSRKDAVPQRADFARASAMRPRFRCALDPTPTEPLPYRKLDTDHDLHRARSRAFASNRVRRPFDFASSVRHGFARTRRHR